MIRLTRTVALFLCLPLAAAASENSAGELLEKEAVKGYVEKVRLYPGNLLLEARMDTGATTSSLNAADLETFEKDGKKWVRFTVDNGENSVTFERPVEDQATIRAASTEERNERYVITLGLCSGNIFREVRINLTDRSHMSYQLLVGRNYLENNAVITSTERELHEPECDIPEKFRAG